MVTKLIVVHTKISKNLNDENGENDENDENGNGNGNGNEATKNQRKTTKIIFL